MLVAKILLIISFAYRATMNIRADEKQEDIDDKFSARLATSTIIIITLLLYYFAGIFKFNSEC